MNAVFSLDMRIGIGSFGRIVSLAGILLLIAPAGFATDIGGSVGLGGQNQEADVLAIQILLNQIPPNQGGPEPILDPDGKNGPATQGAISKFQEKHFGEPDSRVDPGGQTLSKLNEIVEARPFADRIVQVSLGEQKFWRNGVRKETLPIVTSRLRAYWSAVGQNYTDAQLQSADFHEDHPWSAACISWIVKQSGGGADFKYSAAHRVYVAAAKANQVNNLANPFKAFDAKTTAPSVGDIVAKGRAGASVTYENVDDGTSHPTHGDIVVAIDDGKAVTIGGNVSNSVKVTEVDLKDDGKIESELYFAVVRKSSD